MKYNTFAGLMIGATLLLAGCTATSTGTNQIGLLNQVPGGTGPTSGPVVGSDAAGSDTASRPEGSAAPSSAGPESGAPASTGALDGATTAWFTAFCGGLTPVLGQEKDVKTKEAAVAKTDYAAQQELLVDFLAYAGPQLTATGSTLGALPAPTFKGGAAFAAKVVEAFGKSGPGLTATGRKLAAVDVTKGASGLSAAAPDLAAELASIAAPITAVGDLDIPDSTKGELLALPACAKLQATVTG